MLETYLIYIPIKRGRWGVLIILEVYESRGWEKFVVALCRFVDLSPQLSRKSHKNLCRKLEHNIKNNNMGLKQIEQSATTVLRRLYVEVLNTSHILMTQIANRGKKGKQL